jgi:tetratricopeptide (TPR) repeat protein
MVDRRGVVILEDARAALRSATPGSSAETRRRVVEDAFVGREGPIGLLEAGLADALGGHGRIALISGSPGIGKSRLVHEFCVRARARGIEAHCGRCLEAEGAPALFPWLAVLRGYAQHHERSEIEAMMGRGAADIAQAVPELAEWLDGVPAPPRIDGVQARFRFFDSVVAFFRRAAQPSGLVLAFDDLQRADAQTLHLLMFLAKQLQGSRILLVGTFRGVDATSESPDLLVRLAREDPTRCIELSGLTRDDVARYASIAVGAIPPESAVDTLYRKTAGNPLFCAQVLRGLRIDANEDGAPDWGGLDRVSQGLGLRAAIDRHLEVLTDDCRALLRIAAVQGREFDVDSIAPRPSEGVVAEALRAGIIREGGAEPGQYAFTHVLIRDALYDELSIEERARLHAGVGAMLEARCASTIERHLARISYHFLRAAPAHDAGRALEFAQRAGHFAMKHLAFEEAALHFQNALRLLQPGEPAREQRFELLIACGEALRHARDAAGCRATLLEAAALARALDSTDAIVRVASELARHFETGRMDPERVGLLREALARLPAGDRRRPLLEAQLARALLFSGDLAERTRVAFAALASASRSDDPAIAAETLQFCHEALLEPQHLAERRAISDDLMRLAQQHGEEEWMLQACVTQLQDYLTLGDMKSVDAAITTAEALAAKTRQPLFRWYCTAVRATRAVLAGDFVLAERLANEALRFGAYIGEEAAYHVYCCHASLIWSWQGRLAQLEPLLRDISLRYPALASWRAMLATVEVRLGRVDHARAVLAELVGDDLRTIRSEPFVLAAFAPVTNLCALVGDASQARPLYEALLPYADQHGIVSVGMSHHGPMARYLGMLALLLPDHALAVKHFEHALRMAEQIASPPFIGAISHQLGVVLEMSERPLDQDRACTLFSRATGIAESHKLGWLRKAAGNSLANAFARYKQRHGAQERWGTRT